VASRRRQQCTIRGTKVRPCHLAAQDLELVTKDEQLDVLDVQTAAAPNERSEQRPEREVEKREGHGRRSSQPAREGRDTSIGTLQDVPQVREAAEPFVSRLFARGTKLLRTEPLKAMVIGAFVRGLSMRDVESLCEQAGLGKLSRSSASRICSELRERFEAFKRRDLYDIQLAALLLDAVLLCVRPDGPKEGVLAAWGSPRTASGCSCRRCSGCANRTRTGWRSGATSSPAGSARRC
jgi:hypothetical protein